jgi:hypothetical protein
MLAPWRSLREHLGGTTPALPLDLFRVAAGLLACAYFVDLLREASDFSHPGGLIDHALSQELHWFTRLSLLQPGVSAAAIDALLGVGVLSAALLAAGVGPRWCAAICFIIAVSVQRWNFLVYYADDMVIQLILFWLMFLPTGTTLHLGRWRRRLPDAWRETHVPALQLKLFLANVLLVYLVAGITKLTSPMWLSGTALYAILKLPFARAPDFWGSEMLPLLRVLNYAALATEITIPLLLCASAGTARRAGVVLQLGFHATTVALIGIPYANLGMAASGLLFLRQDLSKTLGIPTPTGSPERIAPLTLAQRLSLSVLFGIALTCLWKIEGLRPLVLGAYAGLWMLGLAQNYHLFDWIDERNYHRSIEGGASSAGAGRAHALAAEIFPSGVRYVLLEMNLYGQHWLAGRAPGHDERLRDEILRRVGARACRRGVPTGTRVSALVARLLPTNLGMDSRSRMHLLVIECVPTG